MNDQTRIDRLELDIDLHLTDLWQEAEDIEEWTLPIVAAFMRAAWGWGYMAAYREAHPGQFAQSHGYRLPGRRAA